MKPKSRKTTTTRKKTNERNTRSLLKACRVGDLRRVRNLLAEGVDPDAHSSALGVRPLHLAARCGHVPILRVLLKAGANINAQEGFRGIDRPIDMASESGQLPVVKFLIADGADINCKGVCPALTKAAINNHVAIVEFLMRHDATPESDLLWRSMWSCNAELVRFLIESGLKVTSNPGNVDRAIVSHAVRQSGGSAITELIAKHGADLLSPVDDDGNTPLHLAQHEQTALYLIEAGANISTENRFGETPLHACAKHGFAKAYQKMVEIGADPNAKTLQGFTPQQYAEDYSKDPAERLAEILRRSKARAKLQGLEAIARALS